MNVIKNYKELFDWNSPLLIFDLETTGLSSSKERIIEIGALRVEHGEIVKSLSLLVNPGIAVPYHATKVNGITTKMLQGAESDIEGIKKLLEMMQGAVIIAHNVSFDVGFVNAYLERIGESPLNNKLVDTVRLARKAFPGEQKYSLGVVAQRLGIEVLDAHRAEDDTRVCFELYRQSIEQLKEMESK